MSHTILVDQCTGHISALDFRDSQALQAFISECNRSGIAHPVVMFNVSGYVSSEIPGIQFGPLYINVTARWQDWITEGPASFALCRKVERKVDSELALGKLRSKKCKPFSPARRRALKEACYTDDQIQFAAESEAEFRIEAYTTDLETLIANIELALLQAFQNEHTSCVRQFVDKYTEEYTSKVTKRETPSRTKKQSIQ